ncbi:MAG: hypothetical protein WBF43_01765, partial [Methylocella sp.]
SVKNYPGDCAVEVPAWPTFNAKLKLTGYYIQAAQGRTSNFPVKWNADIGGGPSWICLAEDSARKTLNWNDKDPIDYAISDPHFDVKNVGFGRTVAVPLYYNRIDKKCGYFGPEYGNRGNNEGTYNFQVNGTRKHALGTFTEINTSRGEPIVFKIADWTLPADALPGSKLSFEYKLFISEQRGDVAWPVVELRDDNPAAGGYRSSIDSNGVVILTYQ